MLLFEGQDGNQADVSTYVDYWLKLKAVVGRADFLFMGDCKLAAHDTMLAMIRQGGRFLAPWPRYAEAQRKREEWVLSHTVEERISRRDAQGREVWYRGFQREHVLVDEAGREYGCVIPILFNPRLQAERQAILERHVARTQAFLEELPKKLGKRGLQSREAIEQAIDTALKRDQTHEFLRDQVIKMMETRKR